VNHSFRPILGIASPPGKLSAIIAVEICREFSAYAEIRRILHETKAPLETCGRGPPRVESRPTGMFLLKKVFQLRDHVNPDNEKPFLDHLEDLRVTVFRIAITLIISMVACFAFQKQLMEVLQRPIYKVLEKTAAEQLSKPPIPITPDRWEAAKAAEHAAGSLPSGEREVFLRHLKDPDLERHARIAALQRAALTLPVDKRDAFLNEVTPDVKVREQVKFLIERKIQPEVSVRGDLRMMSTLKPTESFMLSMKLAFFAGIIVAFPLLLTFILQFILPGLHQNEKKVLWPALAVAFGLFLGGVCFAYFVVLQKALEFFYQYSLSLGVANEWRIGEYISFATTFTLLFGVAFELPVVVMVVVKLGLLSYTTMKKTRSYAVVGIMVLAAVLTPTPDIFTLSLMALPMYVLYEICIFLAWLLEQKEKKAEEAEAKERMERLLRDYEEHEDIRTAHNDEHSDHGDDGWKAEETPDHDPYHDYHSQYHDETPDTTEPPKIDDLKEDTDLSDEPVDPAAGPPDSIPEEEERRRNQD
jgi:sec-independent protein translocase protein TatC